MGTQQRQAPHHPIHQRMSPPYRTPPAYTMILWEEVTAWNLLAAIMHAREARRAFVRAGSLEDLEGMLLRVRLGT